MRKFRAAIHFKRALPVFSIFRQIDRCRSTAPLRPKACAPDGEDSSAQFRAGLVGTQTPGSACLPEIPYRCDPAIRTETFHPVSTSFSTHP